MSARRPRLLLVTPLPPPSGGIPTWTLGVLGSDLGNRWEIRTVNTSPSRADSVHEDSRLRLDRLLDAPWILGRVLWQLLRFRPDVVHVNTSYYWAFLRDGLVVWLARLVGARTVLHPHGGDFPEFARAARQPLQRWIHATLRRADCCIALTTATREFLEGAVGRARVRQIPNFVCLEDQGAPPDRSGREGRPVEVLFVGWIVQAKGVRELLRAAGKLPEMRFTLVGAQQPDFVESIRQELEEQRDHVRLLSPRPREEILALYREADLLVLPTWREGFPLVVLEAMAAGLPVIATPVGAIPDALEDGREGILVPPRDAEALEHAIRRLAADPETRRAMGRRARKRVEAEFSRDAVIGRLEALYRELLPGS